MAVFSVLPEGTRVRVRRGNLPLDTRLIGALGTVVDSSEYQPQRYGVQLDDSLEIRYFTPDELDVVEHLPLPPERQEAKRRPALP